MAPRPTEVTHLDPSLTREAARSAPTRKWARGQTYRFVLISCGLFWLVAGVVAWAFLSAH
jgi:hypothetical protein